MKLIAKILAFLLSGIAVASPRIETDYECKIVKYNSSLYEFEITSFHKDKPISFSRAEINYLKPTAIANSFIAQDFRFSIFCEPGTICHSELINLLPGQSVKLVWDGRSDENILASAGTYSLNLSSKCDGFALDVCSSPLWGSCEIIVE